MALRFKVGDNWLQIPSGTKLKISLKSQLFKSDKEMISRAYAFTVPAKPNQAIFKFINVPDNIERDNPEFAQIEADAYLGSGFYKKAKLFVEQYGPNTYNIRAVFDNSYYQNFGAKSLREFKYNNPTPYRYYLPNMPYRNYNFSLAGFGPITPAVTYNFIITTEPANQPNSPVTIKVPFNTEETITVIRNRVVEYVNQNLLAAGVYALSDGTSNIKFYDIYGNDEYPIIGFTFDNVDAYLFINDPLISGSEHPAPGFAETLHANAVKDNPLLYDYVFYPVYVEGFGISAAFNKVLNDYSPEPVGTAVAGFKQIATLGPGANPEHKNALQPFAYTYRVIEMIHDEHDIEIDNRLFDTELKTLTMFCPMSSSSNWTDMQYITRSWLFSKILPAITAGEFIGDIEKLFCAVFDYSSANQKVRIIAKKDVLASRATKDYTSKMVSGFSAKRKYNYYSLDYKWPEHEDLVNEKLIFNNLSGYTAKPAVLTLPSATDSADGDLRVQIKDNKLYTFTQYFGGGQWLYVADNLLGRKPQNATNEITTGISPLFNRVFEHPWKTDHRMIWQIPHTKDWGQLINVQTRAFSHRQLFYRGMRPMDYRPNGSVDPNQLVTGNYPFATYHNYDYKGNKVGNVSLAWYAQDGVWNLFHKPWVDFLENTVPVQVKLMLSIIDIINFDLLESIILGNQEYLVDTFEFEAPDNEEVFVVDCTVYPKKVKYE